MNLLNYLGPAKNELDLAVKQAGYNSLEDFMKDKVNSELPPVARVAYHLGRINLIAEMLEELKATIDEKELEGKVYSQGDEEE
tara:strand:+ start:504 stop:752 length:249 start_codon:yes stop_codon:yes gene_type:complete